MKKFKSWNAFGLFSREITRQRRYLRTEESQQFFRAVAATCKEHLCQIPAGRLFWRAQLGNDWMRRDEPPYFDEPVPFCPARMKPLNDRASEGRANPKGIPSLYLSTTANAAMSEVRPWIGALISLAQFETVRPLTLVDCSVLHDQYLNILLGKKIDEPIPTENFDPIVWSRIDSAFAEPITKSDDSAEYAATQTIAELFKSDGYDGVAYKSAFGDDGFSVALFDLDSAVQIDGSLHKVKCVEFKFEESGSQYVVPKKKELDCS